MIGLLASCTAVDDRKRSEAQSLPNDAQSLHWRQYEGAWFTIEYPDGFLIAPATSRDPAAGVDSVFFESPYHHVRFYVVSPQWGKLDTDISLRPEDEHRLYQKTTRSNERNVVTSLIRATNGTYSREVEEYYEQDGQIYWAFEFRYDTEPTRAKYAETFTRFKASLTQFSD
jgi:hypothetical protein